MKSNYVFLSGYLLLSLTLCACSVLETVHDLQSVETTGADTADAIKFPADFPLPKYPNSKATAATDNNVEKARIRSVMMVSTADADTICSFYTVWLKKNGWTVKGPAVSQEVCTFIAAQKAEETVNLVAMRPKDSKKTTLTINVSSASIAK